MHLTEEVDRFFSLSRKKQIKELRLLLLWHRTYKESAERRLDEIQSLRSGLKKLLSSAGPYDAYQKEYMRKRRANQ